MRRLICVFVVRLWYKQVFSWRDSNDLRPSNTKICAVWSESTMFAWRSSGSLASHSGSCKDWSGCADAEAGLSLHHALRSLCWFCWALMYFFTCRTCACGITVPAVWRAGWDISIACPGLSPGGWDSTVLTICRFGAEPALVVTRIEGAPVNRREEHLRWIFHDN